jgi:enterochelin esterase-like enzyme
MEKDLLGYVMPYAEKEFRVIKDPKARAIMGYSMGGGHSTTIGFRHPELFSVVGGFSGYNRSAAEPLLADPAKANENYKIIFIGSGAEDNAVNGGRALHAAFTDKGVNHIWSEDPGYGHDYQIWRIYLHTLLQKTFRD